MSAELADTVAAQLAELGHAPGRFEAEPLGTIKAERHRPAPSTYPEERPPPSQVVDVGEVIGRGGMGVVWSGVQRSLGRRVAVKTLRSDRTSPTAREELLREAWITGAIEHPNVVPVHALEQTEEGVLVVLKHVEGVPWSDVMHDPVAAAEDLGVEHSLAWNLDVLAQLATALDYAHECGFIHRDVKPSNVLVGRHGEVYLADWGIALSLEDDGTGRFPLASEAHGLCGTPAYLAPEMLGGRAKELGPQTDVYLLGAVLYELLTGQPPHLGSTLVAMLTKVTCSEPELAHSVDPELAQLTRRAMSREPSARYESAAAFASELTEYRRHEDSRNLSAVAEKRSEQLLAELSRDASRAPGPDEHRHLADSRFAYRHALLRWPENEHAQAGLARVIDVMIQLELDRDEPAAAATLLREHPAPDERLERQVAEAVSRWNQRRSELERIEAEFDPATGQNPRMRFLFGIGLIFAMTPACVDLALRFGWLLDSYLLGILATSAMLLGVTVLVAISRTHMAFTKVTKRIVATIYATLTTQLLMLFADWGLGSEPQHTLVRLLLVFSFTMLLLAIQYTPRLLGGAVAFLICHWIGVVVPELRLLLITAGAVSLVLNLIWVRRWALATHGLGLGG